MDGLNNRNNEAGMGIYSRNVSYIHSFKKEITLPEKPESLKKSLIIPKDLETPEEVKVFAFLDTVDKAYINPDITKACHLSHLQARQAVKTLMKKKHLKICGKGLYCLVKN